MDISLGLNPICKKCKYFDWLRYCCGAINGCIYFKPIRTENDIFEECKDE